MCESVFDNQNDACHDEVFSLLAIYYFYMKRINQFRSSGIPEEDIENVFIIEALERDIVMCLCRLDDGSSGVFSFRKYCKELNKSTRDQKQRNEYSTTQKAYQNAINSAKNKARNKYISHLTKAHKGDYIGPSEYLSMIKQAVDTMDVFTGKKEFYILKDDDSGFELDLRKTLSV